MVVDFINYNLLVGGLGPSYGQNSDEFSVDFRDLEFFRNHIPIRWVRIIIFQTGYDIIMPCRFLVGFSKTETHSKTRDSCHMSILSVQGVTPSDEHHLELAVVFQCFP